MTGRHRRGGRARRRWPVVALAVVLLAGTGAYVGYRALTTCEPVEVLVAAAPAVAEPVRRAIDGRPDAETACAGYRIVEAAPGLAADIANRAPDLPAVWLPDSSLALGSLDSASFALVEQRPSLASSPIVLAVPQADAARYGDPAQPVGWTALLTHPQPPALPDPVTDSAGLAALSALHTAIGDDGDRPRPEFVAAVLAMSQSALSSPADGFTAVVRDGAAARAFLTSEQAVVQHDQEVASTNEPASRLVTSVPVQGAATSLDFPFVRVPAGTSPEQVAAVDALENLLRGPAGNAAFAAAGLRAPDGTRLPGAAAPVGAWLGEGIPPARPAARPPALVALRLWSSLTQQSRMLAVIDVSGSMAAQVGGTDRIGLATGAAQAGLALFPDTSEVGLWAFSARPPPDPPWQELVPIGPLTEPFAGAPTRRAALAATAVSLRNRLGGPTALYDTVLGASRAVRAGFRAGASNTVVLITDGRNEVSGGIDLATAVRTLQAEADPILPVPLIAIGLGPDVDAEALRQLAEATGGRSYQAQEPEDVRAVFLDALSQRACRPSC